MNKQIIKTPIEEIFSQRFGRYSKYVIQERALPDVRDGLKPVQRRILYAMLGDNNTYDKQFRKSAKTVGNVIGNYHPHGDTSVYEAMVRMSQSWKVNLGLIIMHGNNGSIDGDNPAAMRYTEAKLSKYANYLLEDLKLNTVKMIPNFDDTELEPTVLPTKIPNLLVNGTSGIASGYATEIPPHNLEEVLKAAIYLNKNPEANLEQLMKYIKAPDFPTGGIIQDIEQVKKAYETGRGKIVLQAKYKIEKNTIIITEIPYEVNKAVLLQKIEQIKINKKVEGINEIIDQSDQKGLEINIKCGSNYSTQMIMNYLLKNTDLQKNYNFNMIAINDKKPELMGLKSILTSFLNHREDIIIKRSNFLLNKAQKRLIIVKGLIIAVDNLTEVVKLIRQSQNKDEAKQNLINTFDLNEEQAEAIVMLQLYRLTNTDISKLQEEFDLLVKKIEELNLILNQKEVLKQEIEKELQEIFNEFKTPRKSEISEQLIDIRIDKKELIKEEKNILTLTENKYIKRTNFRSYLTAKADTELITGDRFKKIMEIKNIEKLIVYLNDGSYFLINGYDIIETKWKDIGKNLAAQVKGIDQLKIIDIQKFESEAKYIISITKKGYISKIKMAEFQTSKELQKIKYQKLKIDDEIISTSQSLNDDNIVILTNLGNSILVKCKEIEENGLKRVGKKFLKLKANESIIYLNKINQNILGISTEGYYFKYNMEELKQNYGKLDLLYQNIKTKNQNINYILTDIEDKITIVQEEHFEEKLSKFTNNSVGDKLRKITKYNDILGVYPKIEVK